MMHRCFLDRQNEYSRGKEVETSKLQVVRKEWFGGVEGHPEPPPEPPPPPAAAPKKRGGGGRRMTFRMGAAPINVLGGTDIFEATAKMLCGTDVLLEGDASDDEVLDEPLMSVTPAKANAEELRRTSLAQLLKEHLETANKEADRLYDSDALGPTIGELSQMNQKPAHEEKKREDEASAPLMDENELRGWYERSFSALKEGKKVVKVGRNCKKAIRTVYVTDENLELSSFKGLQKVHHTKVGKVTIGYTSEEFRQLLDLTDADGAVPPPSNCVTVSLGKRTLSLVFESEEIRNEFLFVMRVKAREAKLVFED